ncbi:MAG: hypothetical protein M3Y08_11620 [Fibrobacterota bacterium]|nr:hypothetical protein [Fibrobacterota bacterium]
MKAKSKIEMTSQAKKFGFSALAAGAVFQLFTGCAMEHESMENPSSVPIAAIDFPALFVVNGGSNSLTVVNASTNEVAGTISLKNATYPHHAYLNPDGSRLSLAVPGMDLSGGHGGTMADHKMGGSVLLLETTTGQTKAARMFDSPNHNAAFSPDGKEIWTSQMASPGKVLVLDAGTLATRKTIEVGNMPAEVTFTRSGKYAFVANGQSNSVTVIDAASGTVAKTIPVGTNPVGAWPGNDSIMYVDNEDAKTITAIHEGTLEAVRTYDLGFTPGMAATSPNGELWVTDAQNGKVVFYPPGSATLSGNLATGAGAHGIVFGKDGTTAYVSNQGAGTVSIIDVAGKSVKKILRVGDKPNGMAIR